VRREVIVVVLLCACSAGKSTDTPSTLRSDSGSDGGFTINEDGGLLTDSTIDGIAGDDCSDELKQIYVVTQENQLHRFAPATATFTKVGDLKCPAGFLATPFSMAVDRKGSAWVLFNDGKLYKVSTKDASCEATTFAVGQSGFVTFGMAYVRDGVGETLFVAEYNGKGIGKIDVSTMKLSFVGDYGGFAGPGELTGRGDQLFAFFNKTSSPSLPARVASIDKSTGKLGTVKNLAGIEVGSGWAFAHWGGTFWLFHAPSGSSQVTEYDFEKASSSTVKTGLPFVIVGAGVSTCAPTERPK
jgi:hypothetical protein